jgi:CheY-like chemotaxis protein
VSKPISLLFIDDDDDYHFFIEKAMENIESYDIRTRKLLHANNLVEFFQTTGFRADGIVLDINMPCTNGFQAIKDLQSSAELKDIPVFMLTNSSNISDMLQCYELGCAGFYTKPDDAHEYSSILTDILEKLRSVES